MKTLALLALLLAPVSLAAQSPDQYTINVHVSRSRWSIDPSLGGPGAVQWLDVVIGGRKYELKANIVGANLAGGTPLLALGDYKAKLVTDKHKDAYESEQAYELLFPDKKTRKFYVVGQTE